MDGAELLLLSAKPYSKIGESVRPPVTTNLMALLILVYVLPGFGGFGECWNSRFGSYSGMVAPAWKVRAQLVLSIKITVPILVKY